MNSLAFRGRAGVTYVRRGDDRRGRLQLQHTPSCRHRRIQGSAPVTVSGQSNKNKRKKEKRKHIKEDITIGLSLETVSQIVLWESAGYPVHPRYLYGWAD